MLTRIILLLVLVITINLKGRSQQRKTENVFLITLDGLRWQELFTGADSLLITNQTYVADPLDLQSRFWAETPEQRREKLMPFFWNTMATQGQLYGNRLYGNYVNCSNALWFSYPGYSEILCGFADDERIKSNNKIDNPNVTVLEFLNRHPSFKRKVAAFGSWDVFPFIINEQRSGIPVNAGFRNAAGAKLSAREKFLNELQGQIPSPWASVRLDAFTHHYAMEYISANRPRVVFIAYGETDDFAHDGRYDAYLKSAHQTDQFIKMLWDFVQSTSAYKNKTTFIITTDHGRGTAPIDQWKSHGKDIPGAGEIWIAVIGPDTDSKGEIRDKGQLSQNQIAGTLAAFLNMDYKNEKTVGEVIRSALKK